MKQILEEVEKFKQKERKPFRRTTWTPNDIIKYPSHAEIVTRKAKDQSISGVFKVDLDDIEKIKRHKWRNMGGKCASSIKIDGKKKTVPLSRFLMDCWDKTMQVDHINRNISDNRKGNLRVVTPEVNMRNRTPIHEREGKEITVGRKR